MPQGTYRTQIFSLAVLLSSMFVYNQVCSFSSSNLCLGWDVVFALNVVLFCMFQMGGIDEASLDRLSLVTQMTKHIRVKASGGTSSRSELGQFSPIFVWLLRVILCYFLKLVLDLYFYGLLMNMY